MMQSSSDFFDGTRSRNATSTARAPPPCLDLSQFSNSSERASPPQRQQHREDAVNSSSSAAVSAVGERERQEERHKPPMSVILIQDTTPESYRSSRSTFISAPASSSFSTAFCGLHPSQSPSASDMHAPFRLQPRQPMIARRSSLNSEPNRGRKRPAHSISSPPRELFPTVSATCTQRSSSSNTSSPQDGRAGDPSHSHDSSLSSPATPSGSDQHVSASSIGSSNSPAQVSSALLLGLSLHSPSQVSTSFGARSCFSRYNASSPQAAAGSVQARTASPGLSECGGSMKSCSPRFARLKVLDKNHTRPPLHTALLPCLDSASSSFQRAHRHSPLQGAPPDSLDDDHRKEPSPPPPSMPPPMVHCRHPSLNSQASALNHSSADSSLGSPQSQHRHPLRETEANDVVLGGAGGGSSTMSAASSCKQSPSDFVESPGGKRSVSSMSPTSTPLPRLSLTPRSAGSRRSRTSAFPAFPSPSDLAGDSRVAVPTSSTADQPMSTVHVPRSRESYIPLPDWGEHSRSASSSNSRHRHDDATASAVRSSFYRMQPTSLLAPPTPDDALERFLHAPDAQYRPSGSVNDEDSLSASVDDETFLLAAPMALKEEREVSVQPGLKQRRLNSRNDEDDQANGVGIPPVQASTTSLRGMDFVTSSTSLRGMDKLDSSQTKLASNSLPRVDDNAWGCEGDEEASIGLMLEASTSNDNEVAAVMETASSSAKSCVQPERDLVTPPTMAQPMSPPPLSPRMNKSTEDLDFVSPHTKADVYYHSGSTPPWRCGEEVASVGGTASSNAALSMSANTSPA